LYAAARVSAHDGAVAFVLGAPDTGSVTAEDFKQTYPPPSGWSRDHARTKRGPRKWQRAYVRDNLQAAYPIKKKDLSEWISLMTKVAERHGISPGALRWETQNWQAQPLFSPSIGPVGIYSVERGIPSVGAPAPESKDELRRL
jgi:hypothetical protein